MATQLQLDTRIKNDKIRRARGQWACSCLLDSDLAAEVRRLIDVQLQRWDAQPEGERRAEDMVATLKGGYYKGYGKRRKFVLYVRREELPF